ncbi:MAG: hypothetical protein ABJB22_04415 [Verrucomicrobiota bacterium]
MKMTPDWVKFSITETPCAPHGNALMYASAFRYLTTSGKNYGQFLEKEGFEKADKEKSFRQGWSEKEGCGAQSVEASPESCGAPDQACRFGEEVGSGGQTSQTGFRSKRIFTKSL